MQRNSRCTTEGMINMSISKNVRDAAQRHLEEQREFVKSRHLESQRRVAAKGGGGSGLVDDRMLAQTMRSVRYEDEGHAAGDLIDNSIESGATQSHIVFKTNGASITDIAFIDDGAGIDEDFLPHATKWGGSSNEGKRNLFGRFGFGLPSASVNRGTRFEVISRTSAGATFKRVGVDLLNLGAFDGVVPLPTVTDVVLPDWVADYVASTREVDGKKVLTFEGGEAAVRTVVIWSDLDRLSWPNRQQSSARFREHLGITYASWLNVVKLFVDGAPVEPVDVLFTSPGHRYYDIPDAPRADSQASIKFEVADSAGTKHPVTVRFSFLSADAINAKMATGGRGAPRKVRFQIRKDYNGIFVTRNGRFIELARPKFINWSNYARQVGIALDFPPELDELFGVTPDKQTITFNERIERMLDTHGVLRSFKQLEREVTRERAAKRAEADTSGDEGVRPSEEAIAKVAAKDKKRSKKITDEARQEAQDNFKRKVKDLAKKTGMPEKDVEKAQAEQQVQRPYRVEFAQQTEDDPFYTPYMENIQLVLRINTEHPWYREVYSKLSAEQSELRSSLELTLWVLAMSEVDATGETKIFYRAERKEWSRRMADAFDIHPLVFNDVATRQELEDNDNSAWQEDDSSEGAA